MFSCLDRSALLWPKATTCSWAGTQSGICIRGAWVTFATSAPTTVTFVHTTPLAACSIGKGADHSGSLYIARRLGWRSDRFCFWSGERRMVESPFKLPKRARVFRFDWTNFLPLRSAISSARLPVGDQTDSHVKMSDYFTPITSRQQRSPFSYPLPRCFR